MYRNCSECQKQFLYTTCSPHILSLGFSCIELGSMNNLLSYCGLVDAKIRASDKDLPVQQKFNNSRVGRGLGLRKFRLYIYQSTYENLNLVNGKGSFWWVEGIEYY